MMNEIIDSPFCDGKAKLHTAKTKMKFRGEEFEVYDHYYKCNASGKEFSTEETGDITMRQLFNQYRERNDIPFPEQIRETREKYGISASKMSAILGFGPNMYKNYEKGDIPNKSNSKLIQLAKNPALFFELAADSKILSNAELEELKKKSDSLAKQEEEFDLNKYLRVNSKKINQFSGYRERNFRKLANMAIYFLSDSNTFITRLNKYLFYSDFLSYKLTGYSMSGYTYCAIINGPVLDDYKRLFTKLWEDGFVDTKDVKVNNTLREQFVPIKDFDKKLFSNIEMRILTQIRNSLRFKSTSEIINLTHEEKGWIDNYSESSPISYQIYAFKLKGARENS